MSRQGRYLLGLDAGGTVVKVALFERDGRLVAAQREMVPLLSPDALRRERDTDAAWAATSRAIRALLVATGVQGAEIAGVGVTGFGNGLCLVDAEGCALMPGILSSDRRCQDRVDRWQADGLADRHRALCFQDLWPGKPLPLLDWLLEHDPAVLARARYMLSSKDLLRLRLTGRCGTDVTDASVSSLLAGRGREAGSAGFALFGLAHLAPLMPAIGESTDIAGELTAAAAEATGLAAGTPVSVGLSDNTAMLLGSGAVQPGDLNLVSGTWGLQHARIAEPSDKGLVIACCQHAVPGQWLAIDGSPNSASAFEWFLAAGRAQPGGGPLPSAQASLYAQANAAVQALACEDPAAPLLFMPHLNAAFDDSQARGAFLGLSSGHHFGHMVRAIYEGIAFEHRLHVERVVRLAGEPRRVRFAGGAANSAVWAQIFANVLERPLEIPSGQEIGALGAVMTTAVALGWQPDLGRAALAMTQVRDTVWPREEALRGTRARFAAWREARAHLHALWHGPAFAALAHA